MSGEIQMFKNLIGKIKRSSDSISIKSRCLSDCVEISFFMNDVPLDIETFSKKPRGYIVKSDFVFVDSNSNRVCIDYDDIYNLSSEEMVFFNLPAFFTGAMEVSVKGNFLNTIEGLTFCYKFITQEQIEYFSKYGGNYLSSKKGEIFLKKNQYEALKAIRKYEADPIRRRSPEEQYRLLNTIRKIAKAIPDTLDELSNEYGQITFSNELMRMEEIEIIESLDIDFRENGGNELKIIPLAKFDGISTNLSENFADEFSKSNNIQKFYKVKGVNSVEKIVVIPKELRSALSVIKETKETITKENFLKKENPIFSDERMAAENIDMSQYGKRVKDLGYVIYRKKKYIADSDMLWTDVGFESFGKSFPGIVTSDDKIQTYPEDLAYMTAKCESAKEPDELIELQLMSDPHRRKIILHKIDLEQEITDLKSSIISYKDIKPLKFLDKLIQYLSSSYKDYMPDMGYYFVAGDSLEVIRKYRNSLDGSKSAEDEEEKLRYLLIPKDNIENLEYWENLTPAARNNFFERPQSLLENTVLKDYQKEGIAQIQLLYKHNQENGILISDDMGMGKTLQILTFLAWLKEKGSQNPFLIVVPSSLVDVWKDEIAKFFQPETFSIKKIKGILRENDADDLLSHDIVLTTYETLRMNDKILGKIEWEVLVCDEAQKVKNPDALTTTALKVQNVKFKIACTATPIENTLKDLWCIVDFVKPSLLDSYKLFKKQFETPLESGNNNTTVIVKLNQDLRKKMANYFMRRTKEVLNRESHFPKKKIVYTPVDMDDLQKDQLTTIMVQVTQGRPVFTLIQKMVMVCSHPDLFTIEKDFSNPYNKGITETKKLRTIRKYLDAIKNNKEKAIIFTKYIKMQRILYDYIKDVYSIQPNIINGSVESSRRKMQLDEFKRQEGFAVIILSPEAAGVGLTITEANHVIHYTRHWNPAKEDQATDRVYRIGQQKDVYVYYPIVTRETKDKEEKNFNSYEEMADYFENDASRLSPEEKLNKIILKKKTLLDNFFLTTIPENDEKEITELFLNDV
jgi:SNF2 family DNA or RNA helicase